MYDNNYMMEVQIYYPLLLTYKIIIILTELLIITTL